jgi:antitoxin (DNA-binding transcriptional repressor) of toxin-antitoxin stability system
MDKQQSAKSSERTRRKRGLLVLPAQRIARTGTKLVVFAVECGEPVVLAKSPHSVFALAPPRKKRATKARLSNSALQPFSPTPRRSTASLRPQTTGIWVRGSIDYIERSISPWNFGPLTPQWPTSCFSRALWATDFSRLLTKVTLLAIA